ncbi:PTS transporter subunit EIIC [Vibrio maritimus]|uniref:PTS transporter subunit EIIC n=1 Tax=Vibrio maritimus TaxID=990268 RepID=UPI003736DB52
MNYKQMSAEIIDSIGGIDNVKSMEHCATRLRIVLNDDGLLNKEKAKSIDDISGYFYQSGQHQFIIGTGKVTHVLNECRKLIGTESHSESNFKDDVYANLTPAQKVVRTLADILIPLIPALVTTGLLMGLRGLSMQLGVEYTDNALALFNMLTDTAFAFIPVLIAYSSAKKFGGNPILAIVVGLMMVGPQLPNAWEVANGAADPLSMSILGFSIDLIGYQGTILPAIFAGWLVSIIERKVRSFVPTIADLIITPFITLVGTIAIVLFVAGPVLQLIEHGVTSLMVTALDLPLGIGYIVLGAVQQLIVITGLHHAFGIIELGLLGQSGVNPLNPLMTSSMAGQFGAAIAIATLLKDKKSKANAYSASASTVFGITEPLIFGVNLQYGKTFVYGMCGGAVGGLVTYIFNVSATGMGITFLPGLLLYTNSFTNLGLYLLVMLSAFTTAFVLTRINNPVKK